MSPAGPTESPKESTREVRVALLRGVNVGGRNKLPMAELRAVCEALGWRAVRSYIQSGNLVFRAPGPGQALEAALERAIAARFGFDSPVVVRSVRLWSQIVSANPFGEVAEREPGRLAVALSKRPPRRGCIPELDSKAANGETAVLAGGALWIHFRDGQARTKLTTAVLDRAVGSVVTLRNWRTVGQIERMARGT